MTKLEREQLKEDHALLFDFALKFQTVVNQIKTREQRIAECDSEASRLSKEVRELQRTLRQLEFDFGALLGNFKLWCEDTDSDPKRLIKCSSTLRALLTKE